ncbi:Cysteine/Histidine-rich C1 domain family protein [Raphanus sativus]|nr:Cysteine/Histidine-rich C1 domain family protein [Raphanus sativus]
MQCDFILHEACANLSRKILNPIHPHLLSLALVERKDGVYAMSSCKACRRYYTAGFVYECTKGEECNFELHVQCATISEPLIHGSHMQPLFLTSKPGEGRTCSVCDTTEPVFVETFNCIECEFSLCYGCATTPQKVRYKHDKHVLSLAYGGEEETNTVTNWCELCERKIEPKERFYACA